MKIVFSMYGTKLIGSGITNDISRDMDSVVDTHRDDINPKHWWVGSVHGFEINEDTAQIEKEALIKVLSILYKHKPFKKLEFMNKYSDGTPEEVFEAVKERAKLHSWH